MIIHIVVRGDTLYSIARRYGVSVNRLITDNGLTRNQTLVVGQALVVLLPDRTYRVRQGDSLYSIARDTGITVLELQQLNPELGFSTNLRVGQELTISLKSQRIRTISIGGFAYPSIQRSTLYRALPFLTSLAVFSYSFKDNGELITVNDAELIRAAYRFRVAPVMVFSSITEDGGFSREKTEMLLSSPAFQERVLNNIVAAMKERGYLGLNMDFEYIPPEYTEEYIQFLERARRVLRPEGFYLSVDVAPKTSAGQPGLLYEAHDYPRIGAAADYTLLMTYEWGYTYGPPMAVAPLNSVRSVVRYAVSEIPADKLLLGVPNYGYDWRLPFEQGVSRAENIGNSGAVLRAARYGAEIQFDTTAASPFYYYTTGGVRHVVWFEDARSIQAKLALADEYNLWGIGIWNIMRRFDQCWALISALYGVRKIV